MAVALSYGKERDDQTTMHPFFQTGPRRPRSLTPSRPPTPSKGHLTFDGVSETNDDNGLPRIGRENESHKSITNLLPNTLDLQARLQEGRSPEEPILLESDIDLNYERRKRRKTSSSIVSVEDELDANSSKPPAMPELPLESWKSQLQQAARETTPPPTQINIGTKTPNSKPMIVVSRPTSARRSTRHSLGPSEVDKQQSSAPTSQLLKSPKLPETSPQLPKPSKSTPPKKMLKLSSKGKLLSSPKQPSLRATRSSKAAGTVQLQGGKLGPSLRVTLKYGRDAVSQARIGDEVTKILTDSTKPRASKKMDSSSATTHPFFLGKVRPTKLSSLPATPSETSTLGQDSEIDVNSSPKPKKVVEWKDIVFASKKPAQLKVTDVLEFLWPPNDLQGLGRLAESFPPSTMPTCTEQKSKSRQFNTTIDANEDIFESFRRNLPQQSAEAKHPSTVLEKRVMSGHHVLRLLDAPGDKFSHAQPSVMHEAVASLRTSLLDHLSAFDLGRLDSGQDWPTKYAPKRARDLFQPEGEILRDWLNKLRVDNVQERADEAKRKGHRATQGRKKRRRKNLNDLDDFIASSDEDEFNSNRPIKNAILLCGPPGCGKTASVFAAANELDFEVFEIHSGMRRTSKDIFDKVGDMTQNHLVQQVVNSDGQNQLPKPAGKTAMTKLFGKKDKEDATQKSSQGDALQKSETSQKESLVLFEEVDVLFEEDKTFWSGVKALIEQSKRPVVLTCNDIRDIQVDDLSSYLHATLHFQAPGPENAIEYLLLIAAKEGHLLERSAIAQLYESKNRDLRAALTELNLWCQMTLGSQQGGLDWTLDRRQPGYDVDDMGNKLRVFSEATFNKGLNVYPYERPIASSRQHLETLEFARNELNVPLLHWYENYYRLLPDSDFGSSSATLDALYQTERLADATSVLSLVQDHSDITTNLQITDERLEDSTSILSLMYNQSAAKIGLAITDAFFPEMEPPSREDVLQAYLETRHEQELDAAEIVAAFEPLMAEKPVFPPNLGRLAPSLDGAYSIVTTDIAPYVRSIMAFDERLALHRNELAGAGADSDKKVRKTRAARAALEGGDKASTRAERWFPMADYERILATGGAWPQWLPMVDISPNHSETTTPGSEGADEDNL